MSPDSAPLRVYGSEISYFTGKLEAYLRYKEIPYERIAVTMRTFNGLLRKKTGVSQIPAVELPDGRFMTDTTPVIAWLEGEHPDPPVIPTDPLLSFVSRLVEDYADEWLWRPALHYRWSYADDAHSLSRRIADEWFADIPLPGALARAFLRARQRRVYTTGDGVNIATRAHVEEIYLRTLRQLEAIFRVRPFLLGDVPTLADFGFFASMFRHFGLDPTPSRIMRNSSPAVYEWLARLWNARASRTRGAILAETPADWSPILNEVGSAYLPYLCANAEAWKRRRRRFSVDVQGAHYERVRTSRYRVWCLEEIRDHFLRLPEATRAEARALLEKHGCWEPLWRVPDTRSKVDLEGRAPFAPGVRMTGRGRVNLLNLFRRA